MTLSSLIKTSSRAAVVALALGSAAVTAMPAQAAEPKMSFQLGFSTDGNVSGFEHGKKKFKPINICLTNRQVERGIERYGFDDANVVRNLGKNRVMVIAKWHWRYYSMSVNKCNGQVSNIRELRKGRDYHPGKPGRPHGGWGYEKDGFSFQFNF
jgi:hypothetical protein